MLWWRDLTVLSFVTAPALTTKNWATASLLANLNHGSASSRRDLPVHVRLGAWHPAASDLHWRHFAARNAPGSEIHLQSDEQTPADGSPIPQRARTECLPARCPDNRPLPDKFLREASRASNRCRAPAIRCSGIHKARLR